MVGPRELVGAKAAAEETAACTIQSRPLCPCGPGWAGTAWWSRTSRTGRPSPRSQPRSCRRGTAASARRSRGRVSLRVWPMASASLSESATTRGRATRGVASTRSVARRPRGSAPAPARSLRSAPARGAAETRLRRALRRKSSSSPPLATGHAPSLFMHSDANRLAERAPTRGRPRVTGSWGGWWCARRLNSLNSG